MVVLSFSVQPTAPLARMHFLHPSSQSLPASGSPEKGRFHLACFRHTNRWSEIARFPSLQERLYGWTAASSSYLDSLGRPAGQRPRSYAPPLTLTKNPQPASAIFPVALHESMVSGSHLGIARGFREWGFAALIGDFQAETGKISATGSRSGLRRSSSCRDQP
jgi:hypothetical protein